MDKCTCKPKAKPEGLPGKPLESGFDYHNKKCPVVADLMPTPQQLAEWQEWCDDYNASMRRAWENAHHYVLGGSMTDLPEITWDEFERGSALAKKDAGWH